MKKILFTNIGLLGGIGISPGPLRGNQLTNFNELDNAYLAVVDGLISEFGPMSQVAGFEHHWDEEINILQGMILPAWCDSHTHLVFPAGREEEFLQKLRGVSYAEIAKTGGILNSATKLNAASEKELFANASAWLNEAIALGTGAIEIKSGYGLTVDGELKMLRVIKRLSESFPLPIKSTFLGAHAIPQIYKDNKAGYVDLVIREMLPMIAKEDLADYIDVFCETGFFTVEETRRICEAGMKYGLRLKLHANQLSSTGAVELGVALDALSVDHLEQMDDKAIVTLSQSDTIGTLLPSAAFFLRMNYPPARAMLDAGCALALASDFNPGSSPSCNMNMVVALACIQMRMLPSEAINAATVNGACAMDLGQEVGSIGIGKRANFIHFKKLAGISSIPYYFGSNTIEKVYINGNPVHRHERLTTLPTTIT